VKIKIHPMSIIVAALLVWKFGIGAFLSSVLAVTLHECFHAIAAKTRGYPSERIIFLPYGATLYNNHDFDKTSNVIIALAGPLLNLSLALFTVAIWWIFPESFAYLQTFFYANLWTGLFNLLPVTPLDGARVIEAISGYKPRVIKLLRIFGIILSLALLIFYLFSLKTTPNFTFLLMAAFLMIYNIFESDAADLKYLNNASPIVKNYDKGVIGQTLYIDENATLQRVLCLIKPDYRYVFYVMKNNEVVYKLGEDDMQRLILNNPLFKKIGEVIPRNFRNP
jgi:stage IV sporulation protein FB